MNVLPIRRQRGIRQIGEGLGTLDREVFEAIAESPSPLIDAVMPRLTRAADHSKLWFAIAAALAVLGGPSAKRGATRGVVSLAATSLLTNQVAKRGLDVTIEVDGGIDPVTAGQSIDAGATALVAGTAVFRGGPGAYAQNIKALRGA